MMSTSQGRVLGTDSGGRPSHSGRREGASEETTFTELRPNDEEDPT